MITKTKRKKKEKRKIKKAAKPQQTGVKGDVISLAEGGRGGQRPPKL